MHFLILISPVIVAGIEPSGLEDCHQYPLFSQSTFLKLVADTLTVSRDLLLFFLEKPADFVLARELILPWLTAIFHRLKLTTHGLQGFLESVVLDPLIGAFESSVLPLLRSCFLDVESIFKSFRERYSESSPLIGDSALDIFVLLIWMTLVAQVTVRFIMRLMALLGFRGRPSKKPFKVPSHRGLANIPMTTLQNIPSSALSLFVARIHKE